MPFTITKIQPKQDDYGWIWSIAKVGYFAYKVYKKEPFQYYDAFWLFTNITLVIPRKS